MNRLSLTQTVQSISTTPAALLGLSDTVGSLAVGLRADLAVLDSESYALVAVLRRGEWINGAERFTKGN